jgi:hypothetical protein
MTLSFTEMVIMIVVLITVGVVIRRITQKR